MKNLLKVLLVVCLGLQSLPSLALTIDITGGVDNPVVIADVPFAWQSPSPQSQDIAAIIDANLERSGYFAPVARGRMQTMPKPGDPIEFGSWRQQAAEYLVIGKVEPSAKGYAVHYELYNVVAQERILAGVLEGPTTQLRPMAHRISDIIFKRITGIDGFFSSSIAYVTSQRLGRNSFNYQLIKADADGENPRVILESAEPIASPSWSPDGRRIAYVSFEKGNPEIYIQSITSGQRNRVAAYPGMNSAPSWSPDGSKLAMTLSKDGNPEIYVYELASQRLMRVTNNSYAIDTEPSWFPDNQTLVFTSDRGGQPQLYRANIYSGQAARITFEGSYNAAGEVFPNGKGVAMVHRQGGVYRIAILDFASGETKVLGSSASGESPSVAGNSNMIMYATKRSGRDTLAVVSADGRTQYYLPSRTRDVRDPAWSR